MAPKKPAKAPAKAPRPPPKKLSANEQNMAKGDAKKVANGVTKLTGTGLKLNSLRSFQAIVSSHKTRRSCPTVVALLETRNVGQGGALQVRVV